MTAATKFQPIDLTDERTAPEPAPWTLKFRDPDALHFIKMTPDAMAWLDAQLRRTEYDGWSADADRDHAHAIREQLSSAVENSDVVLVAHTVYDAMIAALDAQRAAVRELWDVVPYPYDDESNVLAVWREANHAYDALTDAALLHAAGLEAA